MTCVICNQPSSEGDFCLQHQSEIHRIGSDRYPIWANGSSPVDKSDRIRNKILGHARVDLVELPELMETLDGCLTERQPTVGGGGGKVSGSPAPLRLDVLHLSDTRRKPDWDGVDPRLEKLGDRFGVVASLESWTRVVCEEIGPDRPDMAEVATVRTECSVLLEVWDWIEDQQWAEELAEDVSKLTGRVRAALGIRPEYRPRCRYCRNRVKPVDADGNLTSWDACAYGACTGCPEKYPPGPALAALAAVQAPIALKEIAEQLSMPLRTLQRLAERQVIKPAPDQHGKRRGRLFDLAEVRDAIKNLPGRLSA